MEDSKKFVFAVVKQLQEDLTTSGLNEDAQESLEVAIQCLQQAYGIDISDASDAAKYQISKSALEIFNEASNTSNTSKPVPDIDVKRAEEFKLQGNELMKAENFNGAVDCYSKAIGIDKQNAVFYCNRAAAYTKLNKHNDAISDCQNAIRLDANYSRAYGRMGLAYLNLEKYKESIGTYEKALQLDPGNSAYQTNLKIAQDKLSTIGPSAAAGAPGIPGMPGLGGLDLSSLLSNPAVMNMAQSFMQNPQMQQMFGNMMGSGDANPSQPPQAANTNGANAQQQQQQTQAPPPSFGDIFQATQQYAQQMQEQNPELVDQLKSQFKQGDPDKKPEQ